MALLKNMRKQIDWYDLGKTGLYFVMWKQGGTYFMIGWMRLYFLAPKIPFGLNQTKNTIERESKENYFLQNFLYSFLPVIENAIFLFLLFHTFVFYPTIKHQKGSRNRSSPPSLIPSARITCLWFYLTFVFAPPTSPRTPPHSAVVVYVAAGVVLFLSTAHIPLFRTQSHPNQERKNHHRFCTHRVPTFLILQWLPATT